MSCKSGDIQTLSKDKGRDVNGPDGERPFGTDITRAPSEQFPVVSRTGARKEMESGRLCALQCCGRSAV